MTKKIAPNSKLINCVVRLEDGTRTHITAVTKTGYRVEARTKQVPMKHLRAMKNTLVEDTGDKSSQIVEGLRVNINRKQEAGDQPVEAPNTDTVRRYVDPAAKPAKAKPEAAPKEKTKAYKADTKTQDLERRVAYLEKALAKLMPEQARAKSEPEADKGPHYKFLLPSTIKKVYETKLTIPAAAKKIMAKELGLEPKQVKRGMMVNDRRNGLVTFVGYDKEELLFIFFGDKDKVVALPADAVTTSSFTLATDLELDRP